MTKISEAREEYEEKVCKDYLGIPESYCADEFEKLISNMRAGIMAVKGKSWVLTEPMTVTDTAEKLGFKIVDKHSPTEGQVGDLARALLAKRGQEPTVEAIDRAREEVRKKNLPGEILVEKNGKFNKLVQSGKFVALKSLSED